MSVRSVSFRDVSWQFAQVVLVLSFFPGLPTLRTSEWSFFSRLFFARVFKAPPKGPSRTQKTWPIIDHYSKTSCLLEMRFLDALILDRFYGFWMHSFFKGFRDFETDFCHRFRDFEIIFIFHRPCFFSTGGFFGMNHSNQQSSSSIKLGHILSIGFAPP